MDRVESAELFAKKKHSGMVRKESTYTYSKYLENVVNRLKSLGVIDKELLCTGWLYRTMEETDTSFDDLLEKFGTRIAVLVWSLSRDKSLSKKSREKVYVKQLKEASTDAKLIKLCDISANLSDLKKQDASKSRKIRHVKQTKRYLAVIKKEIMENADYPKSITLLESVNQSLDQLNQRKISAKEKS